MPEPAEALKTALADRYRIERELGQGGMATVYLAEDLRHHLMVKAATVPQLQVVTGWLPELRERMRSARR